MHDNTLLIHRSYMLSCIYVIYLFWPNFQSKYMKIYHKNLNYYRCKTIMIYTKKLLNIYFIICCIKNVITHTCHNFHKIKHLFYILQNFVYLFSYQNNYQETIRMQELHYFSSFSFLNSNKNFICVSCLLPKLSESQFQFLIQLWMHNLGHWTSVLVSSYVSLRNNSS